MALELARRADMKTKYKSLDDVPNEVKKAYVLGHYVFSPPPVSTAYWGDLEWINYVTFVKKDYTRVQVS